MGSPTQIANVIMPRIVVKVHHLISIPGRGSNEGHGNQTMGGHRSLDVAPAII